MNEIIDKELSKTVERLTKENKNIISIYLFGSLSRGEGFWEKGRKPKLLSDIDLLVITKKGNIKNRDHDLRVIPIKNLKKIPKDTHNYDIIKTKFLLRGKDLSKKFPNTKNWSFGFEDIKLLFFNRLYINLLSKKGKKEICKTMFTVTDIISIISNQYHPSFIKRKNITKKKWKGFGFSKKFLSDLEMCYDFSFSKIKKLSENETKKMYERVFNYLNYIFGFAMRKYTGSSDYNFHKEKENNFLKRNAKMTLKGVLPKFWNKNPKKNARIAICLMNRNKKQRAQKHLDKIIFYPKSKKTLDNLKKLHGIIF